MKGNSKEDERIKICLLGGDKVGKSTLSLHA